MPKFGEQVFDKRDPQQFRVYAAERATAFSREPLFGSLDEIVAEATRVMHSPTWEVLSRHTLQEGRDVEIVKGRGRGAKARVFVSHEPRIIMPPHQWTRWTLFHELAHCARGRLTANHGPQFTTSYLKLVHDCWSPYLAYQLREQFEQRKVRVYDWWQPGYEVPVPDPNSVTEFVDEGAEDEAAQMARDLREAFANYRMVFVTAVGRQLQALLEVRTAAST